MGWKGVGVGEAFGAIVTSAKRDVWVEGALVAHPASKRLAMMSH